MLKVTRPTPAHFGIYVFDIDRMLDFYTSVFDLTLTDRGQGKTFPMTLAFTSASPDQHHQLAFASGRPPGSPSTVMQISFAVPDIQSLRDIWKKSAEKGASEMRTLNHGNALSIYMKDPEGNLVEVYLDMPFYVAQPHGDPLDLSLSDDEIMRQTEATCRADPTFMPIAEWEAQFSSRTPAAWR